MQRKLTNRRSRAPSPAPTATSATGVRRPDNTINPQHRSRSASQAGSQDIHPAGSGTAAEVLLRALSEHSGPQFASAAELGVMGE